MFFSEAEKMHKIFELMLIVPEKYDVQFVPQRSNGNSKKTFTLWASLSATTQQVGKAGGLQILRCQGFAVDLLRLHPWRLGSEALRLLQR